MNWRLDMYENGQNILCFTDEDVVEYKEEKQKNWVYAGEHGWVNVDNTEFVDISEDWYGNDILTFVYKGVHYYSNIVIGDRP